MVGTDAFGVLLLLTLSSREKSLKSTNFKTKTEAMVSLFGQSSLSFRRSSKKILASSSVAAAATSNNANDISVSSITNIPSNKRSLGQDRPKDPYSVLQSPDELTERAGELAEWFSSKQNVLCITGAGLSTESGIPDYRGAKGSYHVGHKPILHQQFMESKSVRKRYWGRSLGGWKSFARAKHNKGHASLAAMEAMGILGVAMEDKDDFYADKDEFWFSSGHRGLAILTQNVDSLHEQAGSKDVLSLHGGNKVVKCMNCGHKILRDTYQEQLEDSNQDWLQEYLPETLPARNTKPQLRPDGDAQLQNLNASDYNKLSLPSCPNCRDGFFKPDVVFFGDTVPQHRVKLSQQAVQHSDGLFVVGTSLAVHSAFRHVRAASQQGTPIAILNVGETRAEAEGLEGLIKIEAPIGDVLEECIRLLSQ